MSRPKGIGSIYTVLCYVYKVILRDLVKKAIDNPDSDIDEFVLSLLDKLFDYNE